ISASGSTTVNRRVGQATDEQPSIADKSKGPALQGTNPAPREVDRFGRKIETTNNDADRGNVKRLQGLPEGTLIALGWGWGGEFRIGTGRDGSESSPRPLHPNFTKKQFVDLAAGKRHTLFVSDDGLVFSVGEGLSWQLGTTSQFINHPDRRAVQRLPKQVVHPSGDLKAGKDYWVAQAAAGDTFSVTREANAEDAARATEGFLWMKMSVKTLLGQSPSSESLQELWEHILEEERTLHRRFQGRLLSWGSGQRGQLGLGEGVVDRRTPHVIHALAGLPVRSVVAGAAHALCVTLDGKVFSWGCGQDGRLGHGDYKDRWEPCRVEGVGSDPVALIGAGAAHSIAVSLPQSVHLWGRGAHGRLGTGDNKCRHAPVRLKSWPPGFPGCVVKDVALGGAHSIVLAHRSAPTTLANPWGAESLAYAWGYGYCGQLGLGRRVGEIKMPSKIAFDKKELITSIVAGKSFSLAANVQGQMFAWGKGWAGQLGLGIAKDSRVAPTRVDFPGVGRHLVVKMAAGERHASALTLDCSPPPRGWDKDKQWKKVVGSHVGMKKWESGLLRLWRCPRRPPWKNRGPNPEPLFECVSCGVSCVCRKCARSCHREHEIKPCTRRLRVLCQCGMRPFRWGNSNTNRDVGGGGCGGDGVGTHSRSKPAAGRDIVGLVGTEHIETGGNICSPRGRRNVSPDAEAPASPCGLLVSVEDEDDGGDTARWLNHNAVECQRILRGWFGKRLARRRLEEKRRRRREAMEAVWYLTVLGAMEKSIARFDKDEERNRNREGMAAADLESAFYRYYSKLQPVIMALNQQRQALKDFSTRRARTIEGVTLETLASASDPRVRRGLARRETVTLWSRRDVRQLQRQFPPRLRLPEEKVVLMTVGLPAGGDRPKWRSAKGGSGGSSSSGGGEGLGDGTDRIGTRGYCGEARGAGRLGGVADPDVDALVRSCQPLIPRRTADIAGPERLYQRVTRMRASQLHRLSSRRRASFSEGDFAARADKTISAEDLKWAQKLGRYWMGVDNSLGATRYLQIGDRKFNKLADPQHLRWRRGARSLHKFLRTFGPGSVDPDVAAVKERGRAGRAHSLCAPERVYAATVTWEYRHKKLQTLLRAATKRGYPASGDGMKWTKRAERWGGLAPPPRAKAISMESLRRSAQRIVARAAKRGWDLRPSTSKSRQGSGGNRQGADLATTPGTETAAEAATAGPWSAFEDEDGNTYYTNDFTGESVWEIPPPDVATADAARDAEDWDQGATGGAGWTSVITAAGEGEAAAWWSGGGDNQNAMGADSNPFDGYEWPAWGQQGGEDGGETWRGNGEGGNATTGWELAAQGEKGGGAEGWTQEWDEGSQNYYWYNALTGESRW
ncbi:unnamed protein product, partial [Ectocarpus sp. 13 AM-2016]